MATANPDVAQLQGKIKDMKMKQEELEKTIQEMTEENKMKVALQVKQIDERNQLERRVDELLGKLRELSEGNRHKMERLKREHSSEMEDLRAMLYSSPAVTPESPSKRSSIYLQIRPAEDGGEKVKVTTNVKDLQNKISQLEKERFELLRRVEQLESDVHPDLIRFEGENARLRAALDTRTHEFEQLNREHNETLRRENDRYLEELKKKTLGRPTTMTTDTPDGDSSGGDPGGGGSGSGGKDEVHAALTEQLSAANERISSLTMTIEQMKIAQTDLEREVKNTRDSSELRVKDADAEARRLQTRVDDLMKSETTLREECDRVRHDYDLRVSTQNNTIADLKQMVDKLMSSEQDMRKQMEQTHTHYESKLDKTTADYNVDMRKLSENIQAHQNELVSVIGELEAARRECLAITDRYSKQLDAKSEELDAAFERCELLQADAERAQKEQEAKLAALRADLQARAAEVRQLKVDCQEAVSGRETAEQRLAELEQNLAVWKSAASEKAGAESELLRKVTEVEAQAKVQREALQEKINFLSKQVTEKDSTSSDIYSRMEMLEQSLQEKEEALLKSETRVAELVEELQLQRDQYEATLADMDEVLTKSMSKTTELEKKLKKEREEAEAEKQAALKEAEKKSSEQAEQQASTQSEGSKPEVSDRVKELKSRVEDLHKRLEDKEKQLEEKDAEMRQRLHTMMEEFEMERQMLVLDQQATAKVLNERLDKEREAMTAFKENVKTQFDERQEQVKEMMNALKARFAETLKDKEEIFNRRVQKVEKAKEREKLQALTEREAAFQEQFAEYKNRQESNFKAALEELRKKYEGDDNTSKGKQQNGEQAIKAGTNEVITEAQTEKVDS